MYQIAIGESWRLYTSYIPEGAVALGVVRDERGSAGALVRVHRTGTYAQVNAGAWSSLSRPAVESALEAALYA